MEFVFKDLVTKCWWSWAGLVVAFVLGTSLATNTSLSAASQGWLAIGSYLTLVTFFWHPLLKAAKASHKHLLTVCIWSFVLVILGLGLSFYAFYSFAGTQSTKYDKLLNVVPVFVAIWAAGLGWFVHFRLSTKAHRTNNAFSIIMEMRKSSEFLKRQELLTKHFPPGSPTIEPLYVEFFPADSIQKLYRDAGENAPDKVALERAEAIVALKYVLNYFEFMAVGIEAGDLDEDLLYDTISTTVVRLYERSRPLAIYYTSDGPAGGAQPLAWTALDALVKDWKHRINIDMTAIAAQKK